MDIFLRPSSVFISFPRDGRVSIDQEQKLDTQPSIACTPLPWSIHKSFRLDYNDHGSGLADGR